MNHRDVAERWLAAEPDDDIRAELSALLLQPDDEVAKRFDGRLQFGTAGLRGEIGAGPLRMNRLVVRQAAAGFADYLLANEPRAADRGVLIGYDARRKSHDFAVDSARVFAARGVRALLFPEHVPTPVLAWNITNVGAIAGVMVTASHNPPADNGYKVYLQTGSQIVPPADVEIAACIDRVDPCTIELSAVTDPLIRTLGDNAREQYLADTRRARLRPKLHGVVTAYTAMHGVGGATLVEAFERCGWPRPHVVESQQQPDATFPTVAFPNPEEPGAMDLVIEEAVRSKAMLALANDPDADRLGAAIPAADGGWRKLSGDEIGWLLADHILRNTSGADRMVVTTLVSSSLLGRMAAKHGVHYEETFTGFKWIGHVAVSHPDRRLVFGYEQALGYLVGDQPLDKDGITAAVMLTEVAALAAVDGLTLEERLAEIADEFGRHVTAELSVKMPPADGSAALGRLRHNPPASVGERPVTDVTWFEQAGLLRLQLGDAVRLQVRPSGTEPKVKLYGEGIDVDPAPLLPDLARLLTS
jgi:phosphomannomutase